MKTSLQKLMIPLRSSPLFLFLVGLAGLLLVLYGPVLLGQSALYFRDILQNYYPLIDFLKQSLQQGDLPFWNPFFFNGNPQMAGLEPPLFYPLSWMFFVLPFQIALALNLCLHHLLAGAGVYLLGGEYRWNTLARTLSALCFSLGGIMISMNNFHPLQNTVAWMPVLFWLAHRLCRESRLSVLLVFSLAYGLQILSGHLEVVYFTSLMILAYACLFLKERGFRLIQWLSLALILGILLSAIQLLPSLAYAPLSVRRDGFHAAELNVWSYHPVLSYMFALPESNGSMFESASLNIVFGERIFGSAMFFVNTYMGLLAWIGVLLLGLRFRSLEQKKFVLYWGIICLLALILAFGKFTPVHQWAMSFPGLSFFRYPSKFLILLSLALSVLAGWGLNEIDSSPEKTRRLLGVLSALLGCYALGLLTIKLLRPSLEATLVARLQEFRNAEAGALFNWAEHALTQVMQQIGRQFLVCLVLIAGLWLVHRLRKEAWLQLTFLIVVAGFDLITNGINAVWLTSPDVMTMQSPVADYLKSQSLDKQNQARYFIGNEIKEIPPSFRQDIANLSYFRTFLFQRTVLDSQYGMLSGFRNVYGIWPGHSHLSDSFYWLYTGALNHGDIKLMNLLESMAASRYTLLFNSPEQQLTLYQQSESYKLLKYFSDTETYIFENQNWLPRARFHYQAAAVKDENEMTNVLIDAQTNGLNLKQQVILLADENLKRARELVPSQEAPVKQWTQPQITKESNNRVELAFKTNTSGYLVLADQYIQGWKAYDNGKEVPIMRANFLHRALRVGPGQHQIVFEYQPPGFFTGLLVTAISALLWLLLLVLSFKNPLKKQSKEAAKISENATGV